MGVANPAGDSTQDHKIAKEHQIQHADRRDSDWIAGIDELMSLVDGELGGSTLSRKSPGP